mmetsp:Transcript_12466/g.24748  ORF Transcript_12466/g.24748 Transcript_12466/m.24748 type:complete len:173 (-) Transcript_12466:11-529(-)
MNTLLRNVFLAFFATHIPITLLIDGQALLPFLYPSFLRDLSVTYTTTFNDTLMSNPPSWLKSLIAAELLFQVPFFFVALKAFATRDNSIQPYATAYAAHTVTTLIPILHHFHVDENVTTSEEAVLLGFYLPYLLIPGLLLLLCLRGPLFEEAETETFGISRQHATVGKAKLY